MSEAGSRELPPEVRRALWVLRGGLGIAALGIVGFFLSFNDVGAPALAAADRHPLPMGAWVSILAWCAGMVVALSAGWHIRGVARRYAEKQAARAEESETEGEA